MKPFLSEKDICDIARKHGEPVDDPEYCGGNLLYALQELSVVYEKELSLIFDKVEKLESAMSKAFDVDIQTK